MFTGLIESLGTVADVTPSEAGFRLALDTELAGSLSAGDSLAVNGVCLTVLPGSGPVAADVSPETARVTTLGRLAVGHRVNLERPLRADARLGGHFVQGHVDGAGRLEDVVREGDFYRLRFTTPATLAPLMIMKGSIAVDGISLTIADLVGDRFDVQIIPHTWTHTNLHALAVGDAVNLECDLLGKYVRRLLGHAELPGIDLSSVIGGAPESN